MSEEMKRRLVRVVIDANACVGSGMCAGSYPDAFQVQADGHALFIGKIIDETIAKDAAELCPVSAISLVYEDD